MTFQNDAICFDKYLTDYDIKRVAQKYFKATSWNQVPEDARKVFYKSNWRLKDIPNWETITEEPR